MTIFLLASFFSFLNVVEAATYERLFYFREGPNARQSFFAHPGQIDIFAPQNYMTDKEGFLFGSVKPDLLAFAKKNNIKVMPLLTNGSFNATTSKLFLDDIKAQEVLINSLVLEAQSFNYWGWQIDFEQMDLPYRDKFSAFIDRTYQVFQKNNLKLSVAVISQISENPTDYPKNLWERIIGVYDYARLASSTDFISLMSYDDPNSSGPIAGYDWLNQVIDFSLTKIPANKISLGFGLYYWQWRHLDGKRVGVGGVEGIDNVTKKYKVNYYFDEKEQAPYFHFWKEGKGYTIWYENARSVAQKIKLIKENNLRGFSAWALGLELPSVYSVMK
ncbi:MAG: glycosyl hydrolase family 18 protein [Candidatus Paceibacterota bacterium]